MLALQLQLPRKNIFALSSKNGGRGHGHVPHAVIVFRIGTGATIDLLAVSEIT